MPTVLITGASSGLGLEFVHQYSAEGWKVIATCHRPAATAELPVPTGAVHWRTLDITDPGQIAALADEFRAEAIDVLLNNAAIHGPADATASFGQIDIAAWMRVMQINVMAPLKVTEA